MYFKRCTCYCFIYLDIIACDCLKTSFKNYQIPIKDKIREVQEIREIERYDHYKEEDDAAFKDYKITDFNRETHPISMDKLYTKVQPNFIMKNILRQGNPSQFVFTKAQLPTEVNKKVQNAIAQWLQNSDDNKVIAQGNEKATTMNIDMRFSSHPANNIIGNREQPRVEFAPRMSSPNLFERTPGPHGQSIPIGIHQIMTTQNPNMWLIPVVNPTFSHIAPSNTDNVHAVRQWWQGPESTTSVKNEMNKPLPIGRQGKKGVAINFYKWWLTHPIYGSIAKTYPTPTLHHSNYIPRYKEQIPIEINEKVKNAVGQWLESAGPPTDYIVNPEFLYTTTVATISVTTPYNPFFVPTTQETTKRITAASQLINGMSIIPPDEFFFGKKTLKITEIRPLFITKRIGAATEFARIGIENADLNETKLAENKNIDDIYEEDTEDPFNIDFAYPGSMGNSSPFTKPTENTPDTNTSVTGYGLVAELLNDMKYRGDGYFTVFLTKFLELISISSNECLSSFLDALDLVVRTWEQHRMLEGFGEIVVNSMLFSTTFAHTASPHIIKTQSSHLVFVMVNKAILAPTETLQVLKEIDDMYLEEEGLVLFEKLGLYADYIVEYPFVNQTAVQVCEQMLTAMLTPFHRLAGTKQRHTFVDNLNTLLEKKFPNAARRMKSIRLKKRTTANKGYIDRAFFKIQSKRVAVSPPKTNKRKCHKNNAKIVHHIPNCQQRTSQVPLKRPPYKGVLQNDVFHRNQNTGGRYIGTSNTIKLSRYKYQYEINYTRQETNVLRTNDRNSPLKSINKRRWHGMTIFPPVNKKAILHKIVDGSSYSDEEKDLRGNLYDAFSRGYKLINGKFEKVNTDFRTGNNKKPRSGFYKVAYNNNPYLI